MSTAVGNVISANNTKRAVCLMTGAIANVAAPASATAGVPCYPTNVINSDDGHSFTGRDARESTLMISDSIGASPSGVFTIWGYLAASGVWYPIKVNGGTAITATSYQERFLNLGHYDRLALQLASISGSSTTFDAWLVTGLGGTDK